MGYTTDFTGQWTVSPALTEPHRLYLTQFAETRRMGRDEAKAELLPDPLRLAVGLPIGFEGAYYVGTAERISSQAKDDSVINGNNPPGSPDTAAFYAKRDVAGHNWYETYLTAKEKALDLGVAQPGLWCQWVPNEAGTAIVWDEGEKFYEYTAWIEYLIAHFLGPWGYRLDGEVYWQGEENDDRGLIAIVDNEVKIRNAVITYQ